MRPPLARGALSILEAFLEPSFGAAQIVGFSDLPVVDSGLPTSSASKPRILRPSSPALT